MYERSRAAGTRYIRGLPGWIEEDPETRNLHVWVENRDTGKVECHEVEMVVLSVGLVPSKENERLRRMLNLSVTGDGFLMEAHPKLQPVDAPTRGIFFAGCVESPKDVKDSVTQASAAAARAERLLAKGAVTVEAITSCLLYTSPSPRD